MTKPLTFIDRNHRRMFGHTTKLDIRFKREMSAALVILARSEGKVVADDHYDHLYFEPDAVIAPVAEPPSRDGDGDRPRVRERLPVIRVRERLDIQHTPAPETPPVVKPPVTVSMTERYSAKPVTAINRDTEVLVNVGRPSVAFVHDVSRVATETHQVNLHRVTKQGVQQIRRYHQ